MDCIIVDDDILIRMELQAMIKKVAFLNLVGTALHTTDAFQLITFHQPDLVFLDVMMPDVNGFELMQSFHGYMPQIILMSTNKDFAAEGLKYKVTDFLSKPITDQRFQQAIYKAKLIHDNKNTPSV